MKVNVLKRQWKKDFLGSKKKALFTFQRVSQTISKHPKTKLLHLAHQRLGPRITHQITQSSGS